MAPPDGRSWGHFVIGVILHVVVFVAIGPLIGGVVVGLVVGVVGIAGVGSIRYAVSGVITTLGSFFITVPVGYYVGWKAAFFTGLAVGSMSAFVRRPDLIYALGIIVGTTVALLLVPTDDKYAHTSAVISVALAGAVGAAVCVRLTNWIRLQGLKELAK
jgi:hypothetical protein